MAKRIEIFRAGRHTAMDGKSYDFTEQMLRDAVAAYDPAVQEAQLVIGHPKVEDPSYGAVKALHFANGLIEAEIHEVDPAFAELVNAKRYKNVSAAWYLPTARGNPKPGHLYIKHVGLLGAVPPAVKGLKLVHFSESNEGVVEFGAWGESIVASMLRRIREYFIEKDGLEAADRVLPDYQLQSLEAAAREPASNSIPSYSEQPEQNAMTPEEIQAAQAQLAADRAQLTADQAAFAEQQSSHTKAARHGENVAFIDTLITAGKVLPAQKDRIVAFMDALPGDVVVEFAEGDKTVSDSTLETLKAYLNAQPKIVEFGEHPVAVEDVDAGTANFAAPDGFKVDGEAAELHSKALAYQKQNAGTDYITAVKAVSNT